DVFGMGAALYTLLAGKAPFASTSPVAAMMRTLHEEYTPMRAVRPDVSEATSALFAKCLAKDPRRRLPDAAALLEELANARASLRDGGTSVERAVRFYVHADKTGEMPAHLVQILMQEAT